MDALDPRHGHYNGAVAHWAEKEPACPDCLTAARRARKQRNLDAHRGNPRRVPLGDDAIAVIRSMTRRQLSDATGIRSDKLSTFLRLGPTKVVSRDTRAKILAAGPQPWTPIGIQRRLQGLARLGWSMRVIADRTGVNVDGLKRLRRRQDPAFVRAAVAEAVIAVYDELSATIPPAGASATKTRGDAITRGYLSPFAFDNIDDPDERPSRAVGGPRAWDDYDEARVQRILGGDWKLAPGSRKAERIAVIEQWRGSLAELEALSGWKIERDYRISDGKAIA